MINREVIKERLKEIEENIEILAELGHLNRDKFKSDPKIYIEDFRQFQKYILTYLSKHHS